MVLLSRPSPRPPSPPVRAGLSGALLAVLGLLLAGSDPGGGAPADGGSSGDAPLAPPAGESFRKVTPAGGPTVVRCLLEPLDLGPLPCGSAILIEAETGTVLHEQDADRARTPASLVKMMVELLVMEDLESGRLSLGDSIRTSANAATMGGSQVYLKEGETETLHTMLQAIAISSANDAAMAVAEHIAGSEEVFVERMNREAEELGCTGTRFVNVHGLDLRWQERNVTTARDIARIGRELLRHPLALELSSTWRAPLRGGTFWMDNTNRMLREYEGLDGLKTGYTPRAGGCFCATARRDGVRLLSVVMRSRPGRARFEVTRRLLDAGFAARPHWREVASPRESFAVLGPVPVHRSDGPGAFAIAGGVVRVLLEEGREEGIGFRIRPWPGLAAPIAAGKPVGYLDCRIDGRTFASVPALSATAVPRIPASAPGLRPTGPAK